MVNEIIYVHMCTYTDFIFIYVHINISLNFGEKGKRLKNVSVFKGRRLE